MNEVINTETVTKKPRGRPLGFNHEQALESALQVFWSHGYEGASVMELADALGIKKPSMYAAFGNKEELFRKVVARYRAGPVAFVREAMNAGTARQVAEEFLTNAAEFLTSKCNSRGCLIIQGALSCGKDSEHIRQELISHRNNYESLLTQRFEKAKTQGDLPQNVISSDLAKYVATIHQGMSVQATSGASKEELLSVIKLALMNWPTKA